jgi:hypothetical protein
MLSPRVLHFTAHCLYFECLQHTISEVDIHRNIDGDDHPSETKARRSKVLLADQAGTDTSLAHELWLNIMFQYTPQRPDRGNRFPPRSRGRGRTTIAQHQQPLHRRTMVEPHARRSAMKHRHKRLAPTPHPVPPSYRIHRAVVVLGVRRGPHIQRQGTHG